MIPERYHARLVAIAERELRRRPLEAVVRRIEQLAVRIHEENRSGRVRLQRERKRRIER